MNVVALVRISRGITIFIKLFNNRNVTERII